MKNRNCKYYEALDCISHKCEGCNRNYIYNDNIEQATTIDKRLVVLGVVLVLCFAFLVRG